VIERPQPWWCGGTARDAPRPNVRDLEDDATPPGKWPCDRHRTAGLWDAVRLPSAKAPSRPVRPPLIGWFRDHNQNQRRRSVATRNPISVKLRQPKSAVEGTADETSRQLTDRFGRGLETCLGEYERPLNPPWRT
jgi:hypothetical protein